MKFMRSAFFPIILRILRILLRIRATPGLMNAEHRRIRATPGLMNAEHRRIRATPGLLLRRPDVPAERVSISGKFSFHFERESQLKNRQEVALFNEFLAATAACLPPGKTGMELAYYD
jgi:hypothetical protein